jgi:hypothetical protein
MGKADGCDVLSLLNLFKFFIKKIQQNYIAFARYFI